MTADLDARMVNFRTLSQADQVRAIKSMWGTGWTLNGIAHVTKLSVEQIQRALAEEEEAPGALNATRNSGAGTFAERRP